MTSIIKVDTIQSAAGSTVLEQTNATTITLGLSGQTITVPSGATIVNNGTQTGFGGTNTPYFHVYLGSDQSVSSGATHKVAFDTEVYDSNSDYDNSTNYRYTPTIAGKYYFYTSVVYFADADNFNFNKVSIRLNGSTLITSGEADARFGRGRQYSAGGSCIQEMNGSTDYVEVYSFVQSNGASSHFESEGRMTYFGGYKIIE